ncbi:MAG: peptide chain release factor N(5)-glutamine methyltransferase [Thermodesulfobacteriota bacterium]
MKELYLKGKRKFKNAGFEFPDIEARAILTRTLSIDLSKIHSEPKKNINEFKCRKFQKSVERRLNGEPSAYITGEKEFYSRNFKVNPDVLIPRDETELLVEESIKIIKKINNPRVLDLGTGSGCIAVTINSETDCKEIFASDISYMALLTARQNSKINSGRNSLYFINGNLFDSFKSSSFDIIISNPPYISRKDLEIVQKEIKDHEPLTALLSADNGFFHIKKIIEGSKRLLKMNGWCILEVGADQSKKVRKIFKENNFSDIEAVKDLNGIERIVKAKWKK